MNQAEQIAKAEKALVDYIESLEPERREKALKFQAALLAEAKIDPGGMMTVIPRHLQDLRFQLLDALNKLREIASEHAANIYIEDLRTRR